MLPHFAPLQCARHCAGWAMYILSNSCSKLTRVVLSPNFSEEIETQRDEVAQGHSQVVTGNPNSPPPKARVLSTLPGPGFPLPFLLPVSTALLLSESSPLFGALGRPTTLLWLPTSTTISQSSHWLLPLSLAPTGSPG